MAEREQIGVVTSVQKTEHQGFDDGYFDNTRMIEFV
jgi:hypothetical protein